MKDKEKEKDEEKEKGKEKVKEKTGTGSSGLKIIIFYNFNFFILDWISVISVIWLSVISISVISISVISLKWMYSPHIHKLLRKSFLNFIDFDWKCFHVEGAKNCQIFSLGKTRKQEFVCLFVFALEF